MGKKSNDVFTPRRKGKDKAREKKNKYGAYSTKHVREKERLKEKAQHLHDMRQKN